MIFLILYVMTKTIDLNCDMGEGYATDALIMPFISSVNIACGSHAGNEETIKNITELKRIRTTKEGKKKWIEVNPKLLEA